MLNPTRPCHVFLPIERAMPPLVVDFIVVVNRNQLFVFFVELAFTAKLNRAQQLIEFILFTKRRVAGFPD